MLNISVSIMLYGVGVSMLTMKPARAPETISDRIAETRAALGYTQEAVAAAVGVSKSAVSHWETGNVKNLRPENLLALSDHFGVEPRWLISGRGPKSTNRAPHEQEALLEWSSIFEDMTPEERRFAISLFRRTDIGSADLPANDDR